MGNLLKGHLALVTGGGSGIGRAIASGYAREGARVIVADRNAAGAAQTVAAIDATDAWSYELDVSDLDACRVLAARIQAEVGEVSVLVNNAGIVRRGKIDSDNAVDDWYATMAVNVSGLFNVTHAFLDQIRATTGRIINIGSIQSYVHTPNSVAYTTSKGAVMNFTKSLAAELGPEGIRVNAIGPGFIATPLNEAARANNPQLARDFLAHTPLGRIGDAEDIVGPAIFLASDLSQYVSGVLLPADGAYLTV